MKEIYGSDTETGRMEREIIPTWDEKIKLAVSTKKCIEWYQIDARFTGNVVFHFNQGGLAGVEKNETLRKVEKLK